MALRNGLLALRPRHVPLVERRSVMMATRHLHFNDTTWNPRILNQTRGGLLELPTIAGRNSTLL